MDSSPWVINKPEVYLLYLGYICILFEENPLNNNIYHIDEQYALSLEELVAYLKLDLDFQYFLKVIWLRETQGAPG